MTRDQAIALIIKYSALMGIPSAFSLAIATQESGINPSTSSSSAGAVGTMQIMPFWQKTAKSMGYDIYTPEGNIAMGVWIIQRNVVAQHGDLAKAAMMYYGGQGGVNNPNEHVYGGPTPAQYAQSVMGHMASFTGGKAPAASTGATPAASGSAGAGPPPENITVTPGGDAAPDALELAKQEFASALGATFGMPPEQTDQLHPHVDSLVDNLISLMRQNAPKSSEQRSDQQAKATANAMLHPATPGFDTGVGDTFNYLQQIGLPSPSLDLPDEEQVPA